MFFQGMVTATFFQSTYFAILKTFFSHDRSLKEDKTYSTIEIGEGVQMYQKTLMENVKVRRWDAKIFQRALIRLIISPSDIDVKSVNMCFEKYP